jgi:hypothetical protein
MKTCKFFARTVSSAGTFDFLGASAYCEGEDLLLFRIRNGSGLGIIIRMPELIKFVTKITNLGFKMQNLLPGGTCGPLRKHPALHKFLTFLTLSG